MTDSDTQSSKIRDQFMNLAVNWIDAGKFEEAETLLHVLLNVDDEDIQARELIRRLYRAKRAMTDAAHTKNPNAPPNLPELLGQLDNDNLKLVLEQSLPILGATVEATIRQVMPELLREQDTTPLYLRSPGHELLKEQRANANHSGLQKMYEEATPFSKWEGHMRHALKEAKITGHYLEFGVYRGGSTNFIAKEVPEFLLHGFDSFEGLPEPWLGNPVGHLNLDGHPPAVEENVRLHVGEFKDTLPNFIEDNEMPIAFAHIDSDLYWSAKFVLETCSHLFNPGTIIVFDEYVDDERRAFQEFVATRSIAYRYLSYHLHEQNKVLQRPHSVSLIIEDC